MYNQQRRWLADAKVLVGLLDAAQQLELQVNVHRLCCWALDRSDLGYICVNHLMLYRTIKHVAADQQCRECEAVT